MEMRLGIIINLFKCCLVEPVEPEWKTHADTLYLYLNLTSSGLSVAGLVQGRPYQLLAPVQQKINKCPIVVTDLKLNNQIGKLKPHFFVYF